MRIVAKRLYWGVFILLYLIAISASAALSYLTRHTKILSVNWGESGPWGDFIFSSSFLTFSLVGALICRRHPGHRVGHAFLFTGHVVVLGGWTTPYSLYGLVTNPGSVPYPELAAWFAEWNWVLWVGSAGIFGILLFPDGKLPSPRWRVVAWLGAAAIVLSSFGIALSPGALQTVPIASVTNPVGVDALGPMEPVLYMTVALIPLCLALAASSVVVRYRRARGQTRLQLKWLAAGGGVLGVFYAFVVITSLVMGVSEDPPLVLSVAQTVAVLMFLLIPLTTGIAILKYRLYDIDRIINRTLVYGALSLVLGAFYLLSVVALQGLAPFAKQSDLAVAASTLAAAALFRPLRGRIQRAIDRHFYRYRYDAMRTIASFSERTKQEVDQSELSQEVLKVVSDTMQPSGASLWVRAHAQRKVAVE